MYFHSIHSKFGNCAAGVIRYNDVKGLPFLMGWLVDVLLKATGRKRVFEFTCISRNAN